MSEFSGCPDKLHEEFFAALEFLKELQIVNGEYFINDKIQQGKKF